MTAIAVQHLTSATEAIDPSKAPAKPFVFSHPCIRIGFLWDPDFSSGTMKQVNYWPCWALLDTGADGVYVDQELIARYNCPIAKGGDRLLINNRDNSTAHRGTLFVIEETRGIDMWVAARDFKRENKPFSIILGRRFLQFCTMIWNGPEQLVTLNIGEHPGAF